MASFLRVGGSNLSCSLVFSRKEVTLKYTNIISERNTLGLVTAAKTIPRVKLALSLTIYGNTWFPKHRRKPNVSWYFPRSLLIYSGCFSRLQGGIWESNPRISPLGRCWGTLSWLRYQRGKPLSTDKHAYYLTWRSWIIQHWKCHVASILSTKWAAFSSFDTDSVTSWFPSISVLEERLNLTKQWKTLQIAWAP